MKYFLSCIVFLTGWMIASSPLWEHGLKYILPFSIGVILMQISNLMQANSAMKKEK